MSKKTQRISHLLKIANEGDYLLNQTHIGVLNVRRNRNREWGYIYVKNEVFNQRRIDLLGDSISEWKTPEITPHISIFTKDEVKEIPGDFKMPETMEFVLTGKVKKIKPKDWIGVSECVFEVVECPGIIEIRKLLNFSPFMFKNHEFHITLGYKKEK